MIAFLRRLKDRFAKLASTSLAEHWHDVAMVAAAILVLIMMVIGWRHPDHLAAFGDALAKLPSAAWDVIFAILGLPTLRRVLSSPDQ